MDFIGRIRELETSELEYKNGNSFVVLYGRRKIGKTALIREFIKDKAALYFFSNRGNGSTKYEKVCCNISFFLWAVLYRKSKLQRLNRFISCFCRYSTPKKQNTDY